MLPLIAPPAAEPLTLRPYQQDAIDSVYSHLRCRDDNPCIVIPTGGGKTPIIATLCRDAVQKWGGRVLILAHVKELLEQSAKTLQRIAPDLNVGIYSSGLNARDTHQPVIIAGIQSVYRRAHKFDPFQIIVADEAHLIPLSGEGMYRSFLEEAVKINPNVRVIGLTATPYRLKGGIICQSDHFLNSICYEIGVRELIDDGFLCSLRSKAGKTKANLDNLHIRGGEFVAKEVEDAMDNYQLVESACREIIELTAERKSVLIFASGVDHGRHVAGNLKRLSGVECGFVCGDTPGLERELLIHRFKTGELKFLANVNVLTTGFDAPNVDCVVLLRPTNSMGLYYQMVGRGFRLCDGKEDCLVLDYGGNILRHGPIDALNVKQPGTPSQAGKPLLKECPHCGEIVHIGCRNCPDCGYEFQFEQQLHHEATAAKDSILSSDTTDTSYEVEDVEYYVHVKFNAPDDAPASMRVEYRVGLNEYVKEWVCLEHTGYARNKAVAWWTKRSREPVPLRTEDAVELARSGALAEPERIVVRTKAGEKFPRIIRCDLGTIPPRLNGADEREGDFKTVDEIDYDDLPF
jgi:DNA repair protein RadD